MKQNKLFTGELQYPTSYFEKSMFCYISMCVQIYQSMQTDGNYNEIITKRQKASLNINGMTNIYFPYRSKLSDFNIKLFH
jgi:hypothetical protein